MHPPARIRLAMPLPPQGLRWLHAFLLLLGLWWAGAGAAHALPLPEAGDGPVHAAMVSPQGDESEPAQEMLRPQFVCRVSRPDPRAAAAQLLVEAGDSGVLPRVPNLITPPRSRPEPVRLGGGAQAVGEPLLRPPTALG